MIRVIINNFLIVAELLDFKFVSVCFQIIYTAIVLYGPSLTLESGKYFLLSHMAIPLKPILFAIHALTNFSIVSLCGSSFIN